MKLQVSNIRYHRQKEFVEISESQALLMISDLISAALANSGFTADIRINRDLNEYDDKNG